MSIWDILGIQATTDIKQIKTAFSEKTKSCHPEEHPQEFQLLHKAYKAAVQYAKNKVSVQTEITTHSAAAVQFELSRTKSPEKEVPKNDMTHPSIDWREDEEKHHEDFSEVKPDFVRDDWKDNNKENLEASLDENFDFSVIAEEAERQKLEGRFWWEFSAICWNQNLRNNPFCWEYFFGLPYVAFMMRYDDTRRRLVSYICENKSELFLWHRDTIQLLDRYLKQYHMEPGGMYETDAPCWQALLNRKRNKKFGHGFADGGYCANLDNRFIGWDGSQLNSVELVQAYIQKYFDLVPTKRNDIMKHYKESEWRKESFFVLVLILGAARILFLVNRLFVFFEFMCF